MASSRRAQLLNITKKAGQALAIPGIDPKLLKFPFYAAISRTKAQVDYFDFTRCCETVGELLAKNDPNRTWEECCLSRAADILALGKKSIVLAYSGGIDSTAMLVSFLRIATPEQKKRIVVLMSHHSIYENPSFFDRFAVQFRLSCSLEEMSDRLLGTDSILVTGEHGDQLFGSDLLKVACEKLGDSVLREAYEDSVPKIIELNTKTPGSGAAIFARFQPIVEECPFPIRTAHDFFWWFNFTQKWQHVKYRFLAPTTWNLNAKYGEEILHFYDSVPFQLWSLRNHDLKIRDTWESYKFTAKEYIYRFTKDRAHLALRKEQSLEKTFLVMENRVAVSSDFRAVSPKELHQYAKH